MPSENDNDESDPTFERAQAITGGILSGLTKWLPHLIAVVATSLGGAALVASHANHEKSVANTQEIWAHSGIWQSNYMELRTEVTNLQAEVAELKNNKNKTK